MTRSAAFPASSHGFSFLEVLIALSVLLVGSVAILSLFALGAHDAVQRKLDARLAQVRPEVQARVQQRLDATPEGKDVPPIENEPLSQHEYSLRAEFHASSYGQHRVVAHAIILFRGRPVRVLPPIPLTRSVMSPPPQ